MTCYHPIPCLYPLKPDNDGKRRLIFDEKKYNKLNNVHNFMYSLSSNNVDYLKIRVPCGKCLGCKMDYSRQYALRSMDEKFYTDKSCFVTLTFNDEFNSKSVSKLFLSQFLKRFRYYYGENIRFLACGEYGSPKNTFRPHYHILFYNFRFDDLEKFQVHLNYTTYRSPSLEKKVWCDVSTKKSLGYSIVGDVSLESSAYVARYCTKKLYEDNYNYIIESRGLEREFLLTSRMPGLGFNYFMDNHTTILNRGYSTLLNAKGKFIKFPIPRYYEELAKKYFVKEYEAYKERNLIRLSEKYINGEFGEDYARLKDLEDLAFLNLDKLPRFYEIDKNLHNIYN